MNEFAKSILLDLTINKDSIEAVEKTLAQMGEKGLLGKEFDKKKDALSKQLTEQAEKQEVIAKLQKDIAELSKLNTKEAKETVKALQQELATLGVRSGDGGKGFIDGLAGVATSFLTKLASTFSDAWKEMNEMLEYSQLSNAQTRNLRFSYGFSSSQAYGYTQAMQAVGIQSEEDLMYMNSQEQRQFREAMTKYAEKYSKLEESGFFVDLQEYQFEMADMKMEIQQEIIEFFIDNKQLIKTSLRALMQFAEFAVTALGEILSFLGRGASRTSSDRISATSDIINSYSTSRQTNVNIDNTFNNVSQNDQTWLANAGQMTYEQIVKALA